MSVNEPPRTTLRQRIVGLIVILLIIVLWTGLVSTLAVIMILRSASDSSSDQSELPDYYYDPGVWESPVH